MYSNGSWMPILSFMSQDLFNGIKNLIIQWVLTLEIIFWKFRSPSILQLLKWSPFGSVWAHSFTLSYTPMSVNVTLRLHSQLTPFHAPCFSCEPKVKVAIICIIPLLLMVIKLFPQSWVTRVLHNQGQLHNIN
jgi:hypothetical protein